MMERGNKTVQTETCLSAIPSIIDLLKKWMAQHDNQNVLWVESDWRGDFLQIQDSLYYYVFIGESQDSDKLYFAVFAESFFWRYPFPRLVRNWKTRWRLSVIISNHSIRPFAPENRGNFDTVCRAWEFKGLTKPDKSHLSALRAVGVRI
jgi:hypothetical protein